MWVMEMGLTMAQGIDMIGPQRCAILLAIEQALSREIDSQS